jgi:hypothetical protein
MYQAAEFIRLELPLSLPNAANLCFPTHMAFDVSNTTKILSAALQRVARLEPSLTRDEKETPAQTVAKGVTVSLSNDAKMHILKDTMK